MAVVYTTDSSFAFQVIPSRSFPSFSSVNSTRLFRILLCRIRLQYQFLFPLDRDSGRIQRLPVPRSKGNKRACFLFL